MKKTNFMFLTLIFGVFLVFSCGSLGETELDPIKSRSVFIGNANEADNLLEKYDLTLRSEWFIWNDYMPGGKPYSKRDSICTIWLTSPVKLPKMEVFATIITNRITIPVLLKDIYDGKGNYGDLFLKDFRPVTGIKLNDGEEYTIEIILKINGEHQTFTFENQIVYVTH